MKLSLSCTFFYSNIRKGLNKLVSNNRSLGLVLIFLIAIVPADAQFFDSLSLKVGTQATLASKDYQPLWLTANHFGTITDQQKDISTFIRVANKNAIARKNYVVDGLVVDHTDLTLNYGVSLYLNNHFKNIVPEEAYLKLEYKNWSFRAGRFEEITGDIDKDLSSGSLGISGNALPIPKIGIAVTDYTKVPFTHGWLQFKGTFAHGWFGNNRYMKDAYYHEKTFYMRLGPGKFKLYGGLQHFAEWGGRRGNKQLERSWKGFTDVLFIKEADDGSVGTAVNGRLPSRPGDQRGLIEAGFYWDGNKAGWHGYAQMPFESGEEVDIRNRSVLAGLSLAPKGESTPLKKIVLELIYTKEMNNYITVRQRQSYYNNGFYKTGWEYEDRIIGTPLFMNRTRASKYFSGIQPFDWDAPDNTIPATSNIVNNRVFGVHAGALYLLSRAINAKTLFTYSRNYGTNGIGVFSPHKVQFYTLQEFFIQPSGSRWIFNAGAGFDFGELASNLGIVAGCVYKIY